MYDHITKANKRREDIDINIDNDEEIMK